MVCILSRLLSVICRTSEEIVAKHQVNFEKFKEDLDSVVKDLADPAVAQKVEKNLKRARNLVNEILYKDAEKNCGASSSSAKDSERLKPLIDKAQVFMEQLNGSVEQSKKAVDLAKQMTTVVQERSESAIKKLQKSMDEVKQELGANSDQIFQRYKDSIKGQLDSLKREANETAAKIRDPEKKKEFVDSVQQTVAKGSVTVLRNVKKLIEKAEEKIEETQKKK